MKKFVLIGLIFSWVCRSLAAPAIIYVSPEGNDNWSGQRISANQSGTDGPMATPGAAIERSRQLRRNPATSPKIILRAGEYSIDKPLEFRPEDSGLVVAARRGEHPVITGEVRITGWKQSSANPNVWQADCRGQFPVSAEGVFQFRELYFNGQRKQRARLPVSGYFHAVGGPIKGQATQVRIKPGDVKPEWGGRGDVELVLYTAWAQSRNQIRSVSEAGDVVTLAGDPFPNESENNPRYFIENVPDALQPGEWYLDRRTGTVSYWAEPGENVPSAVITAPRVDKLARLEGTIDKPIHDIVLEGLTFTGADWPFNNGTDFDIQAAAEIPGAFEAQWAEFCEIRDCRFTRLGGYAIDLGQGCSHDKVAGCDMYDLGGGGIRIGESTGPFAARSYGISVTDNHIHHIGRVSAPAVGILDFLSASTEIAHNEINDTFYTGISMGWTWGYGPTPCKGNMVEFNHIHDIGQGMLSDMGGVYTLGLQPGTVIRNNLIHDVTILNYGGWGLYTDEGSSGIVLESNIVYHCQSAGFHQHYGETNLVYNNIFALNKDAQLRRTRPETHLGFTFTNNIVYFDSGNIFDGDWSGSGFRIDHNIYFDTRVDGPRPMRDSYKRFQEWRGQGRDLNSRFVDPMFVAPLKGDFRLRPDSPALQFGFHPLDLRDAGPRKKDWPLNY